MIQLSKKELKNIYKDPTKMTALMFLVDSELRHKQDLYYRYRRKPKNYNMMMQSVLGCGGVCEPFEQYIVNFGRGYLAGKPPIYDVVTDKVREETESEKEAENYADRYESRIANIQKRNNDSALFSRVVTDYLVATTAYIYVYQYDGEQRYIDFSAEQTVAIYDFAASPRPHTLIRKWVETSLDGANNKVIVEFINSEEYLTISQALGNYNVQPVGTTSGTTSWVLEKTEPIMYLGKEPFVVLRQPDEIAFFEPALDNINRYEQIMKNIANTIKYNDDAKLLVMGYDLRGKKDDEKARAINDLLEKQVISVGANGDIRWLLKNMDYSGNLDVIKLLQDDITMFTSVPNMTDQGFSNADNASALSLKLYPLDQYIKIFDSVIIEGFMNLWRLITIRLNQLGENFHADDLQIIMQRNRPNDETQAVQRAQTLYSMPDIFSKKTVFEESGVNGDYEEEKQKIKQEAQETKENEENEINENVIEIPDYRLRESETITSETNVTNTTDPAANAQAVGTRMIGTSDGMTIQKPDEFNNSLPGVYDN